MVNCMSCTFYSHPQIFKVSWKGYGVGEEPGHPPEMTSWKTESQKRRIRIGDIYLGVSILKL